MTFFQNLPNQANHQASEVEVTHKKPPLSASQEQPEKVQDYDALLVETLL